jgi:hypothetical protein
MGTIAVFHSIIKAHIKLLFKLISKNCHMMNTHKYAARIGEQLAMVPFFAYSPTSDDFWPGCLLSVKRGK